MTDSEGLSLGEIGRTVKRIEEAMTELRNEVRDRHHTLANQMNAAIGPVSIHSMQIESQEKVLVRIDQELKAVTKDANRIAGAGALLAVLSSLVPWPWKAH